MNNIPWEDLLSLSIDALFNVIGIVIVLISFRVFMTLAIHYDAKSIGVKDEVVWIVFTVFFPITVPFIYLCCRKTIEKNVPKMCTKCGASYPSTQVYCTACNSTDLVDYQISNKKKHKKNSYFMLALAGVMIVVFISFVVQLSANITDYVVNYNDDFTKYFNEFDDDYSDDFDFYYDDDFSDFFE